MNARRRRKRDVSPVDGKQLISHDEMLAARAAHRLERRHWWDENRPGGEGETPEGDLYQWVRVTNAQGEVLGTFYLQQSDDKLERLFLTAPRKGLPPNPYDETALSNAGWGAEQFDQARDQVNQMREAIRSHPGGIDGVVNARRDELLQSGVTEGDALQARLGGYRDELEAAERGESRVSSSSKVEKFLRNAQSTHGQRLTRVVPVAATDRDTRFKFLDGPNGFTVRGSKLGPVLMGDRRAGMQHVTLEEIRQALHHLA